MVGTPIATSCDLHERPCTDPLALACMPHAQARRLEEEAAAAAEARRRLRARPPPPTTCGAPAVPPRPEPRPLTVPEPFALRSEVWAGRTKCAACRSLSQLASKAKARRCHV
jgi:hypothetical protein